MWHPKVSIEELKTVVQEALTVPYSEDVWMITWIDKIGLDHEGNPYFKASIHRIMSSELEYFKLDSLDLKNPTFVTLPLRIMRLFPVGTLIKYGITRFLSHHTYIPKFVIDLNTTRDFERNTLGKWKYGDTLIKTMGFHKLNSPYSKQDDNRFAANSEIIVFKHPKRQSENYDYIVIPAAEIARFYWFTSSKLFRALMNAKAASRDLHNELYVPELTMKKSKNGVEIHQVILRDEMHLLDAEPIARLAFSGAALYSANTIYKRVQTSKIEAGNVGALYLDCAFPFRGDTTLQTRGYIADLDEVSVLMVTEIARCSGPMPFDVLYYDHETPRKQIDTTQEKKGYNTVPPKEDPEPLKDDDEPEERFQGFLLDRHGFLKPNPLFDHKRKNDNLAKPAQFIDKGARFIGWSRKKFRLERFESVPPKNEREGKAKPFTNASTNYNTQNEADSLGLDVVSKETDLSPRRIVLSDYARELTEYFISKGAQVDFVRLVDDSDPSAPWYQSEPIPVTIKTGKDTDITLFMFYIRVMETEFILCWMDMQLGTSLKLVTKLKIKNATNGDNDKHLSFDVGDVSLIVQAIQENHKTMDSLNSQTSGFRVSRLYNVVVTTVEKDYERMLAKIGVLGYKD